MTLASLAYVLALALSAAGEPNDNPLGFADPEALSQFDAAMTAWNANDFATAARLLDAVYALEPKPELHYALGQLARLQGDCVGATARFEAFLDTEPASAAAAEARVNIERCAAELEREANDPVVPPPVVPGHDGALAPADRPAPPTSRRRPDTLGVSLTAAGAVIGVVGVGLFGGAFATQRSAEREEEVDRFEMRLQRARAQYWTGVGLAAAGTALLVGGVVRLLIVRRAGSRAR